jgi:hypothetical protein
MPLEELHGALVLLRRGTARKRAEIAPPAGLRIFLSRIEPVFAGRELANHDGLSLIGVPLRLSSKEQPEWPCSVQTRSILQRFA